MIVWAIKNSENKYFAGNGGKWKKSLHQASLYKTLKQAQYIAKNYSYDHLIRVIMDNSEIVKVEIKEVEEV